MARRKALLIPVTVLVLAASAAAADAGTLVIGNTSYRTGEGGEFNIKGFDDAITPPTSAVTNGITSSDKGDFKTFCLEHNEFISLGSSYTYTIDTLAKNGGVSGQVASLGGDPLSSATAKLYYAFWSGQLSGYDYTTSSGRGAAGQDLQNAIWYLEGERTSTQWSDYVASHSQAQTFYDFANSVTWADLGRSDWSDIGLVRVLNLYDSAGAAAQSQLVVVPLPTTVVMGLALLGGLGAAGLFRRRLQAQRLG